MLLSSGSRLGPYEILAPLGSGGMGEVYRARDTRLDRSVAIKILPVEFSSHSERLHRFHREARSASALNHPNIVTIYELGQDGSTHYIAMELIEGSTLRDLLSAGSLPIRRAILIAAQVAEGLAKAHAAGIAHRDIKPANLMISQDGFVKILDFGLAKPAAPAELPSDGRTLSAADTRPGLIIGTPEYMSPEQAAGLDLDFRSDQFSFGLVLYEMITGKRPFSRPTVAETLVAILREQPEPVNAHAPDAPAPLCWVVERCLSKEPEKRYANTQDIARELTAMRERFSEKPAAPSQPHPGNIPVQRTGFVGREKEISAARELLLSKSVRLVTITGPGGIGKTRLAVEVASSLAGNFSGGVHFVPLSGLTDPNLIASAIVQALEIREAAGFSPLEVLRKALQDSFSAPLLLLLDNFEHLIQAAPTVAKLLEMSPNLKILVTSRSALHIYGEHEFPVPALGVPDPRSSSSSIDLLSQYPAVALFVQRAAAARPNFELDSQNASAIIEICARLDGLPLAIELAAARLKVLSPASLRTRLASRLQMLTGGARDLPQRQQTLRAAIDWSYDLLTPAEQTLFRRLSVFVGGCTLEGAEAVCDTKGDLGIDLLDGICSMVDKSLIQQLEQPNGEFRFVMLETIREYAREKLAASGEEATARRAHAAYFLVLAEEVAVEESDAKKPEWLDRFKLDHDNFRAAIACLIEARDADWGLRLGGALFRFWEQGEYFAEGSDSLTKLLQIQGANVPTKALARAIFGAGVLAGEQRDFPAAEAYMHQSLAISRQLNDPQGVAVSLNALAVLSREHGNIPASHTLFEESLAQWREIGDRMAVARSLSNLANILRMEGDFSRSVALHQESLLIFQELGDRMGVAWSHNYQGDVARETGNSDAAQKLYEQGLSIFLEIADPWGTARTLSDLGTLARERGDCAAACSYFRESLTIFRDLEHNRGVARLLECFACLAAVQHQPQRALRLAGAAAALRQNIGTPLMATEQAQLEAVLDSARQALPDSSSGAAWLEGWGMPLEKAIDEVLREEPSSS
ncbi:MAG TPA: protein kinase [Candidatus Acidoferrum sp.]|nr:protein kinase [Candidatus Acidoferrum sp.]